MERWFAELTRKRIRRGGFGSVEDLKTAIEQYIQTHNQNPRPFVGPQKMEEILEKVRRCKAASVTQH